MCYSKEVTFAAGTLMVIGSAYAWHAYVRNQENQTLRLAFKNIILGYLCVALHQFAESISIAAESAAIYKFGLIASITCMFFYMRSLEALSKLSFGSLAFALLITLCSLSIIFTPIAFENFGFWVRGSKTIPYLIWSSLWLLLFIYWNMAVLYVRHLSPSLINKRLLIDYALFSIDISFMLYVAYAYFSLFIKAASYQGAIEAWNVFASFDIAKDSPSIWCVFSVIQAFLIPPLFKRMSQRYDTEAKIPSSSVSWQTKAWLAISSFSLWLIFLFIFPMLFAAALKMMD